MHRISQTAGVGKAGIEDAVFRTVQTVINLRRGAAHRSQMDRSLRVHGATSAANISRMCRECCASATVTSEYREGVGRVTVRVCTKPSCNWRDDVAILAEPALPASCAAAATLRYITARLAVLGAEKSGAAIPTLLDPLGKSGNYRAYQKHNANAHHLVKSGALVEVGTGTLGTPLYVVCPCAKGADS